MADLASRHRGRTTVFALDSSAAVDVGDRFLDLEGGVDGAAAHIIEHLANPRKAAR